VKFFCLGCGVEVDWDGRGLFAYTCLCRATGMVDGEGRLVMPLSFYRMLRDAVEKRPRRPPHIDHYLGVTGHTSDAKMLALRILRDIGAVYSWECGECRERILNLVRVDVDLGVFKLDDLHPSLARMLREVEG